MQQWYYHMINSRSVCKLMILPCYMIDDHDRALYLNPSVNLLQNCFAHLCRHMIVYSHIVREIDDLPIWKFNTHNNRAVFLAQSPLNVIVNFLPWCLWPRCIIFYRANLDELEGSPEWNILWQYGLCRQRDLLCIVHWTVLCNISVPSLANDR